MDTQAVLVGLNKLAWFRHRSIPTRLWWSAFNTSCSWVICSIWIEHLNFNLIVCFKVEVPNCQAVVGSFSFLKEEQLVRPQVTVSALVVHPGPVLLLIWLKFSEANPVSQETRHPGVPRRRLPVHPDPAVLVVAHRSELLILWISHCTTPFCVAIFRIATGVFGLCICILIVIFFIVIVIFVLIIAVVIVVFILCSGAMHRPQEDE